MSPKFPVISVPYGALVPRSQKAAIMERMAVSLARHDKVLATVGAVKMLEERLQ